MILFVNVFITNQRLVPGMYELSETRKHNKLDIFKYTLSSYAVIPWSRVFIYCELDDAFVAVRDELEQFIRGLFPNNLILNRFRISTYGQWKLALDELNQGNDEWVWFTCNDDHVFIDSDLTCLEKVLSLASNKSQSYRHVAVLPSHWHEFLALKQRNRLLKRMRSPLIEGPFGEGDILEDNQFCFVTTHRTTISMQIVNRNLLNFWFSQPELLPEDLRRTDTIRHTPDDQISITPYRELVRHFDGYSHSGVSLEVVPVMMIPNHFFEGDIKIQYGCETRRDGFVWIHPFKEMIQTDVLHSERTTNSQCDMNILLEDIPLFWKGRVAQVVREELDPALLRTAFIKQKLGEICADPRLGFLPVGGAIEHYRTVFMSKYTTLTSDELCELASNMWKLKDYMRRMRIVLPYLGSSRIKALERMWFAYGMLALLRHPGIILELVIALIKNPKRILKLTYKRNKSLLEDIVRVHS